MFALENIDANDPRFGRIATFTWPELSHDALETVRKEALLKTAYPRIAPETAFGFAVKEFDNTTEGGRKIFVRLIGVRTAEFIYEVVVPDGPNEVKGMRENLFRVVLHQDPATGAGNSLKFDAYMEEGLTLINGLGDRLVDRYNHHLTHVNAAMVSEWAERLVVKEYGGFPLENRGHSVHVRGAGVAAFDRFMDAMHSVSRGEERVQVFKTLDTDPASMASLLSSIAARVEEAIKDGEKRAMNAKTARGINTAVDALMSVRSQIGAYKDLLGDGLNKFVDALDKAAVTLSGAEVIKAFGGLPEKEGE